MSTKQYGMKTAPGGAGVVKLRNTGNDDLELIEVVKISIIRMYEIITWPYKKGYEAISSLTSLIFGIPRVAILSVSATVLTLEVYIKNVTTIRTGEVFNGINRTLLKIDLKRFYETLKKANVFSIVEGYLFNSEKLKKFIKEIVNDARTAESIQSSSTVSPVTGADDNDNNRST